MKSFASPTRRTPMTAVIAYGQCSLRRKIELCCACATATGTVTADLRVAMVSRDSLRKGRLSTFVLRFITHRYANESFTQEFCKAWLYGAAHLENNWCGRTVLRVCHGNGNSNSGSACCNGLPWLFEARETVDVRTTFYHSQVHTRYFFWSWVRCECEGLRSRRDPSNRETENVLTTLYHSRVQIWDFYTRLFQHLPVCLCEGVDPEKRRELCTRVAYMHKCRDNATRL